MSEEIQWETKRSRVVGPRGWLLCLTLGALLCTLVVGQRTQQYAQAEVAGEGDAALAQVPSVSLSPQGQSPTETVVRYNGMETLPRRDQSWVLGD